MFSRAERARTRARELTAEFSALCELLALERDLRAVTGKLARAVSWTTGTAPAALSHLLDYADELLER